MPVSGGLSLRVGLDPHCRAPRVELRSQRPVEASRVLIGKPVEAAATLIPLLFSLCGHAQGIAARRAVEAALGQHPSQEQEETRQRIVATEAAQELAVPMVLDWPSAQGIDEAQRLNRARALRAAAATVFARGQGTDGQSAARHMAEAIERAMGLVDGAVEAAEQAEALMTALVGRPLEMPCRPLPPLSAQQGADLMRDPAAGVLPQAPLWQGAPAESGPMATWVQRQGKGDAGRGGLAIRAQARRQELIDITQFLRSPEGQIVAPPGVSAPFAWSEEKGCGLGVASSARGTLIHRVRLEKGLVADWMIVAPTEWTCHPAGVLPQAAQRWAEELMGQGHDLAQPVGQGLLRQGLEWLVRVMDPCVPCQIDLTPLGVTETEDGKAHA
jgi:Ni,Fe-hydrogenase I large subunit